MSRHDLPDHYGVLGVARTATPDEIKTAYRRLARQTHPDIIGAKDPSRLTEAQERFKRVTHAYDVLGNQDRREEYDRELHTPTVATPTYSYTPPVYTEYVEEDPGTEWREFVSRPLDVAEKLIKLYTNVEWVGGLVVIGLVVILIVTGKFNVDSLMQFVLTTNSTPDIESIVPILGAAIGGGVGLVVSLVLAIHAIVKDPTSFFLNEKFRERIERLMKSFAFVSLFVGGLVGFLIGRYFF